MSSFIQKNISLSDPKTYTQLTKCPVCGQSQFIETPVLWPELISTWELTPAEIQFINRQQGFHCTGCHANLRSMTLAAAINEFFNWQDTLTSLVSQPMTTAIRLLEINEAGTLHPWLVQIPNAQLAAYPDVDMQNMIYADNTFDLVVHSDTLEHIPDPVQALRECLRIIKPGGCMLMTIPILPSRFTRRRIGLPASYHGNSQDLVHDMLVHTEYGADFFLDLFAAGWHQISLFTLTGSESFSIVGTKPNHSPEVHHGCA